MWTFSRRQRRLMAVSVFFIIICLVASHGAVRASAPVEAAQSSSASSSAVALPGDVAPAADAKLPGEAEFNNGRDLLYTGTDVAEGIRLIHEAAEYGFAAAQNLLGTMYAYGVGVPRSGAKAALYHSFAARNGNVESNAVLAFRKFNGVGMQKSFASAAAHAKVSADAVVQGYATNAAAPTAILLGKPPKSSSRHFELHHLQAQNGNVNSVILLGYAYLYGNFGLKPDPLKALSYFAEAANKNEKAALGALGQMYAYGFPGVPQDIPKAIKAFTQGAAAPDPHPVSLNGLGYLHAVGVMNEDRKPDWAKAFDYFSAAANANCAEGVYNLATLHLNGRGTPRNVDLAASLFMKARALGSALAAYQLANLEIFSANKPNYATAVNYFMELFPRGKWQVRLDLGYDAYQESRVAEALLHYLALAEQGVSVALLNAAYIVEHDEVPLLEHGAHQHHDGAVAATEASSSNQLGELGLKDEGKADGGGEGSHTGRDSVLHALHWQAALQGEREAHVALGDNYLLGRGVAANPRLAEQHYHKAAQAGSAEGHFKLASVFESGTPYTTQDFFLAKRHYDACAEADSNAAPLVYFSLMKMNFKWWLAYYGWVEPDVLFGPDHGIAKKAAASVVTAETTDAEAPPAETNEAASVSDGATDKDPPLDASEPLSYEAQARNIANYVDAKMPTVRGYGLDTVVLVVCFVVYIILCFLRHNAA